jgi:hypothetical protein
VSHTCLKCHNTTKDNIHLSGNFQSIINFCHSIENLISYNTITPINSYHALGNNTKKYFHPQHPTLCSARTSSVSALYSNTL